MTDMLAYYYDILIYALLNAPKICYVVWINKIYENEVNCMHNHYRIYGLLGCNGDSTQMYSIDDK